ncbi:MAG TPA: hypothetical protein VHZ03_09720 [Trebonia sp.]|jgi:hypothetical protein|nr:hypothetical protein [Trebonia sp.]
MDPVTLIVTALVRLRGLVRKRFKDPANGEYVLEKHASACAKPALGTP